MYDRAMDASGRLPHAPCVMRKCPKLRGPPFSPFSFESEASMASLSSSLDILSAIAHWRTPSRHGPRWRSTSGHVTVKCANAIPTRPCGTTTVVPRMRTCSRPLTKLRHASWRCHESALPGAALLDEIDDLRPQLLAGGETSPSAQRVPSSAGAVPASGVAVASGTASATGSTSGASASASAIAGGIGMELRVGASLHPCQS